MTESAAPVTAAATPSFRILLHRFAVPMLWFFIGVTFLIGLTPYRLLPDVFLFACAFVWFKKPQLRRARVLCLVLTGFLLMELLLPFDVSILYWPGRSCIVRLVFGFSTVQMCTRARCWFVAFGRSV